jgi:hypothetical protein
MTPELCPYCADRTLLVRCEIPEHWERRLSAFTIRPLRSVSKHRCIHLTPVLEAWWARRQKGRGQA